MVQQETLLVILVRLVERIPLPPPPAKRGRGRPATYSDRLFLKALVIMIVKQLHSVHGLLSMLEQPTFEMKLLRELLSEDGIFPSRRTWERRLKALPTSLPAQIGCLGRYLVATIKPWASCGRGVAWDSTVLRAAGPVWHKMYRDKGEVPHHSIDTQAHWTRTKSGWHGWVYGWKLHIISTVADVADVWIPLATAGSPIDYRQQSRL
jgi:hypothetical protein